MAIFERKVEKDKKLTIKVKASDLDEIKEIQEGLNSIDPEMEFNIEDKLYDQLTSLITSAKRELKKLEKEANKNDKAEKSATEKDKHVSQDTSSSSDKIATTI